MTINDSGATPAEDDLKDNQRQMVDEIVGAIAEHDAKVEARFQSLSAMSQALTGAAVRVEGGIESLKLTTTGLVDSFNAMAIQIRDMNQNLLDAVEDSEDETAAYIDDATADVLDAIDASKLAITAAIDASELVVTGAVDLVGEDTAAILDILTKDPAPGSWQDQPDLIDTEFRPVLGVHTGGDGGTKSDPKAIALQLGHPIQAAPIYWKTTRSPRRACQAMLDAGTVPRLELCFPHIFTSIGGRMMDGSGKSFWARAGEGGHNSVLIPLLLEVAALDRPILISLGHESDLRSEDGASPKNEDPPVTTYCGDWSEFPAYHARLAELVRNVCPKARIFLNFSGGFGGPVDARWDTMLPPAGTFDFFGWDPYNMKYKQPNAPWQSFRSRFEQFNRWSWYKRTIPDVPLIVGETGTCQGNPKLGEDAGEWLLDMVEYAVENRWRGVGTGGGISQIHYFSHHYTGHPRCLDEPHDGTGQMWGVLPVVGADDRLAWAELD